MTPKYKDLQGQTFSYLKVLRRAESDNTKFARWVVECSCGVAFPVRGASLISGNTTSCGCRGKEPPKHNLWREARMSMGLSKVAMANRIGSTGPGITKLENGPGPEVKQASFLRRWNEGVPEQFRVSVPEKEIRVPRPESKGYRYVKRGYSMTYKYCNHDSIYYRARISMGITRSEMARRVGVSCSDIEHYEKSERLITHRRSFYPRWNAVAASEFHLHFVPPFDNDGDREAFEHVFHNQRPFVRNLIKARGIKRNQLIDDLVMEVFELYMRKRKIDPSVETNPRRYLSMTARYVAYSHFTKCAKLPIVSLIENRDSKKCDMIK